MLHFISRMLRVVPIQEDELTKEIVFQSSHGVPIAAITSNSSFGSNPNGEAHFLCFIKDNSYDGEEDQQSSFGEMIKKIPDSYKKLKASSFNKELLKRAIRTNNYNLLEYASPSHEKNQLKKVYKDNPTESTVGEQSISPPEGMIFRAVPIHESFRMAVVGPSGVGKSTFIANLLVYYHQILPENHIFIWSFFDNDPAYDILADFVSYIHISEQLINNPPQCEEFENSVLVFDDIESLSVPFSDIVSRFRDQALQAGRKMNISVIAVSHEILGGFSTKAILNECEQITVFPRGNQEPIFKLLSNKYNFCKQDITWIQQQTSRFVCIKRSHPQCMLTTKELRCTTQQKSSTKKLVK
jgi:hypothetical protein